MAPILSISFDRRPISRLIAGAMALSSLAACADAPSRHDPASPAISRGPSADPPGAARPLSIGGRLRTDEGDELTAAVHCAAALDLTAQRIASVSANRFGNELALFGQAESFYLEAAAKAAADANTPEETVMVLFDHRRAQAQGEGTRQAQLAIACLRRFGDSLDAQEDPLL